MIAFKSPIRSYIYFSCQFALRQTSLLGQGPNPTCAWASGPCPGAARGRGSGSQWRGTREWAAPWASPCGCTPTSPGPPGPCSQAAASIPLQLPKSWWPRSPLYRTPPLPVCPQSWALLPLVTRPLLPQEYGPHCPLTHHRWLLWAKLHLMVPCDSITSSTPGAPSSGCPARFCPSVL